MDQPQLSIDHRMEPLAPGLSLGKFRIVSVLGHDCAGVVYEADDTRQNRRVALRQLDKALSRSPQALNSYFTEARAAARVSHPNVAAVLGIEEYDGGHLVVMEFAGGGSAADKLAVLGRLPWRDATRFAADACRGLGAAHDAGLVHRDIQPAKLLVTHDGTVKVADLGCVPPGAITRSPYMPPEQWRNEALDARSDVYALGATYYTLLTGKPPFGAGATALQLPRDHCERPVPNVRAGLPNVPLRCDAIIRRAMAKDPAQRYPTAAAMLADLQATLAADDTPGPPPPPPSILKPPRAALWQRLATGAGWLAAVAALLGAGYFVVSRRDADEKAAKSSAKSERQLPTALPTVTNSVGMTLARVPAGLFLMGEPFIADARPPHPVKISRPFLIGVYEVTQGQYQRVTGVNPSAVQSPRLPVEQVTWGEAVAFCERLSALDAEKAAGRVYRLPTEAEWEYCCRAGTGGPFAVGPALTPATANCLLGGLGRPAPVGTFAPNPWGLYDMHGNVAEWCADRYSPVYYGLSPVIDPTGPAAGTRRVVRGGSWNSPPEDCHSAKRIDKFAPDARSPEVGFRVICTEKSGPETNTAREP
jgi:formylglycine-generating enzyme required for sulfatase activity